MSNTMQEVVDRIKQEKLIVIVRKVAADQIIPLAHALYEGGVRLMEITFDAQGDPCDEDIASSVAGVCREMEGKMFIGTGTVLNTRQVDLAKKAGARFIISPNVSPEVIRYTKAQELVSIPGAFTATEAEAAHEAGADFVKLFPAGALGPSYLKQLSAPLSHIQFLAVGGFSEQDIPDYLKNGARGFGIGTNIVSKACLARNDYEGITAIARHFVQTIHGEKTC